MVRSQTAITVVVALAICLIAASPAVAATQVGSDCAGANDGGAATTAVSIQRFGITPPAPGSDTGGVITSWNSNSALGKTVLDRLKVLRPAGPKTFTAVGESSYQSIAPGQNSFPARIAIHSGDRLGLYAAADNGGIVYCGTSDPEDRLGYLAGDLSLETSAEFGEIGSAVLAVSATIEPDRDGDGYGDETQDGCPQSAAFHGPCPTITLDTFPVVLKRSILVLVGASETSSVQVFGQVGWKPRHKGGALATKTSGKPGDHISTGVIVGLSGGTTLVKPGEVTPYNVKLPKSVIRHLSDISPKQVVKGTITAQTTDLAGRVTDHTITIRLHGRKAPTP